MSVYFPDAGNGLWNTPQYIKDNLHAEFEFDFDPCPMNPVFDGLVVEWGKMNFCNPPFNEMKKWLLKIVEEQEKGRSTVLIMPARTYTGYFHDLVLPNVNAIRFVRGRICYEPRDAARKTGASPWPTIICVFKGHIQN
jgi:hypothetical protein